MIQFILFPVKIVRTLIFAVLATLASCLAINLIRLTSQNFKSIGNKSSIVVRRIWGYSILATATTWIKVENAELLSGKPVVLMTNHSGYLDIPAVLALFPGELRIIAKAQLGRMWFVGKYLRNGHFLLSRDTDDREKIRKDRETLLAAAEYAARHNASMLVFPEGTRSPDGRLRTFRHGAFLAAVEAGLPIQPVALLGPAEIMPKNSLMLRKFELIRAVVCKEVPTAKRHWREIAGDVRAALLAAGCRE